MRMSRRRTLSRKRIKITTPGPGAGEKLSALRRYIERSITHAVMWPLAAVIICLIFRAPLSEAIREVSHGELSFNKNGEMRVELQKLATTTSQAAQEMPTSPPELDKTRTISEVQNTIAKILDEASKSPKVALMKVSFALEKKAQIILAQTNWAGGR